MQRHGQRLQIARIARADRQTSDGPFQIAHLRQLGTKLFQLRGVIDPALHHFPARFDGCGGCERLRKPVAQAASAHGRDRAIQRAEKGRGSRRIMTKRLQDFQMAQRGAVEHEIISRLIKRECGQVRNIPPQVLSQVVQDRSSRADGCRSVLQPESIERRDLEMIAHGELRGFRRKNPIVVGIEDWKGCFE